MSDVRDISKRSEVQNLNHQQADGDPAEKADIGHEQVLQHSAHPIGSLTSALPPRFSVSLSLYTSLRAAEQGSTGPHNLTGAPLASPRQHLMWHADCRGGPGRVLHLAGVSDPCFDFYSGSLPSFQQHVCFSYFFLPLNLQANLARCIDDASQRCQSCPQRDDKRRCHKNLFGYVKSKGLHGPCLAASNALVI